MRLVCISICDDAATSSLTLTVVVFASLNSGNTHEDRRQLKWQTAAGGSSESQYYIYFVIRQHNRVTAQRN
jgi:hypothetical protein